MTSPLAPAGWYQDPARRHQYRYWDGGNWSETVANNAVTASDPLTWQPQPPQWSPPAADQGAAEHPIADQQTIGITDPTNPRLASGQQSVPPAGAPGYAAPWAGEQPGQPAQPGQPGQPGQWQPSPSGGWQQPGSGGQWQQPGSGGQWQQPAPGGQWAQAPGGYWPQGQAPAGAAPRKRRSLKIPAIIAGALVIVLAVVLVIWRPWYVPPVLQPLGLAAGVSTNNAVSFHWAPPASGPVPDKYVIWQDGQMLGKVSGTSVSYQVTNLAPDSSYSFRVAAERGGKRSPLSAVITLRTLTPPVSEGRVDGPYSTNVKVTNAGGSNMTKGQAWTDTWTFQAQCSSGACTTTLSGHISPPTFFERDFTVTLTRNGAVYTGTTKAHIEDCSTYAEKDTLHVTIAVNQSATSGKDWMATGWAGTITMNTPYVSVGNGYCTADVQTFKISGAP